MDTALNPTLITRLDQLDLTRQYSYADYLLWKITERIELIRGWLFRMAAPNATHQSIAQFINTQLVRYFEGKPCMVFFAPFDVRLPIKGKTNEEILTVVEPDLCVICDLDKIEYSGCLGAPDLVVEILSPGNTKKEMKYKYEVYEEAGVREYWAVHPNDKSVIKYVLDTNGQFIGSKHYYDGEMMPSTIFEGLEIDLTKVFSFKPKWATGE